MTQAKGGSDHVMIDNIEKILNDCFKFDTHKGVVNAKSKKKVNITFKPNCRFEFATSLVCYAKEKLSKELTHTVTTGLVNPPVEKDEIKIKCKGDYPLLRLTDVRNDTVSIANLWERFELTKMNKQLLLPLSEEETAFNSSDDKNSGDNLEEQLCQYSWDFGKVPSKYGTKPRRITLTLKNIGGVQADWFFKMPNDSEI